MLATPPGSYLRQRRPEPDLDEWEDSHNVIPKSTIEKQIMSHSKTHSSLQRSQEVDRARDELVGGPKAPLYCSFPLDCCSLIHICKNLFEEMCITKT